MSHDKDKLIEKLKSEIAMLKNILYKMPGNVYWKDVNDQYLGCNEHVAKMFRFASPEEVVGKYGADFIPTELAKQIHEIDRNIIAGKVEVSFDEEGVDAQGKRAIYISRKTPLYDEAGQPIGLLGISIDTTQQKNIEEKLKEAIKKAEAANRAKSQFLAMISHEIRIPLTSTLGFAHFLQEENLSPEERKFYIDNIVTSGNYLLTLITKILDYSKLEADKVQLVNIPCNIKSVFLEMQGMFLVTAKEKNLSLYLDCDSAIPNKVICDPDILRQILINLIGNAIKFTDVGGVTLRVRLLEQKAKIVKLEFAIKDTGVGIPSAKLKSIFQEFYQVEDIYTRSKSKLGTGLGLAIVKRMVELMHGKMKVISKVNQGSMFAFTVSFPWEQETQPITPQSEGVQSALDSAPSLRVLLVEDDQLVQFVHHKMLTNIGCEVDVADTGMKAMSLLDNHYHIIFVDIGLPDLNGFELIKEMRMKLPASPHTPIIALTGFFTDEERKRCISAGADEVMIKPVSQTMLKKMVLEWRFNKAMV